MTPDRSRLRIRKRPHIEPGRAAENIIEVLRGGQVVATIYGTREGVHITSGRLGRAGSNKPFYFAVDEGLPGYVIPLVGADEVCPWCEGRGAVLVPGPIRQELHPCPVCSQT